MSSRNWFLGCARFSWRRTPLIATQSQGGSQQKENESGVRTQAWSEIKAFFLATKLNLLLLAVPFAVACYFIRAGDGPVFVFSLLSLCPLAERLGFVTEQLAMYTNDTLGGLLNASFGNATELIICGFALHHGLLRIIQLSLLGSVVSNLLLVLGSAFIAGGLRGKSQSFNQEGISVNCGLLLLSVVSVLLPSLLKATETAVKGTASELALSRCESVLLLLSYFSFLLFQLYTHSHLYEDNETGDINGMEHVSILSASATPVYKSIPNFEDSSHSPSKGAGKKVGNPQLFSGGLQPEMEATGRLGLPPTPPPLLRECRELQNKEIQMQDMESSGLAGPNPLMRRTNSGRRTAAGAAAAIEDAEAAVRRSASQSRFLHPDLSKGDPSIQGKVSNPASELDGVASEHEAAVRDKAKEVGDGDSNDGVDDDDELVLSRAGCFIWLTIVTCCIAVLSDWILDAIEGASKSIKVPMPFLTTILLPIVGNAAEHASALMFAYRNRIEISLGVAVGSATQIAVLVIPFCVVLAWILDKPLDLDFNAFEAATYFISVLLAAFTVIDGKCNWLKGLLLLLAYCFVAAGFWLHKDTDLDEETAL